MRKEAQAKTAEKFVCPECGKAFKNRGGLGSHMTYLGHKTRKKPTSAQATRGAQRSQPAPSRERSAAKPVATASVSLTGAHQHLRAAREALVQRDQEIETELNRLTGLQNERERIRRELDAVNTALEVFGDKAPKAHSRQNA